MRDLEHVVIPPMGDGIAVSITACYVNKAREVVGITAEAINKPITWKMVEDLENFALVVAVDKYGGEESDWERPSDEDMEGFLHEKPEVVQELTSTRPNLEGGIILPGDSEGL